MRLTRQAVPPRRSARFRRGFVTAVALCAAASSACVGPARTRHDYRLKAATTAGTVRGALETARLGVRAANGGRAPANYLSVLIGEAEEDASAAQSTFESIQPPDRAGDHIREQVLGPVGDAVSVLERLRVLVRRGETSALGPAAESLPQLSAQLDQLAKANGG